MFEVRYKSHHDVEAIISNYLENEKATKDDFLKILNSKNNTEQLDIYFHTPYCDKICSFCNMNRKQLDNNLESYTDYICNEIEKYGKYKFVKTSKIGVIFFGGGTPTIYKSKQLERILRTLRENFKFSTDYEMTFETTLHNLTKNKIQIFEKYGVNRISIGIQTFSNRGRKYLNRSYDKNYVIKRIKEIRKFFSGLICIDIIYNYPNQTDKEIIEDAEILSKLNVDSASFYSLMIHGGSKISKDINNEEDKFVYNIKRDEKIHNLFYDKILEKGYKLLELTKITNGKDRYMYIRNGNALKNLLPIGAGAGGRIEGIGCYNFNQDMSFYSKSTEFHNKLSLISGMMQFESYNLEDIKKICLGNMYEQIYKKIEEYKNSGYLEVKENKVYYTAKGIFWGNSMIAKMMEEILKNMRRE